jgi:hypothetical protein
MLELNEFIDAENAVNDAVEALRDVAVANVLLSKPSIVSALLAYEEVPVKEPTMPFVTVKDPLTVELFCAMTPLRAINSLFGIF